MTSANPTPSIITRETKDSLKTNGELEKNISIVINKINSKTHTIVLASGFKSQ